VSTFKVEDDRGRVLLETDDWVEAESRALCRPGISNREIRYVRGTHPTHDWYRPGRSAGNPDGVPRCHRCGGWDNGSYGSHAPCGYDFQTSLVATIERELAARADGGTAAPAAGKE
jgi:hypothetical protein